MALRARVGRHTGDGGRQCQNWPDDQRTVVDLLNSIPVAAGGAAGSLSKPVISGVCSDELYRAISTFEDRYWPGQRSGYVDPDGPMLSRMQDLVAKSARVTGAIRFVTPEQWLGPPSGKTRDISDKELPLDSNSILWIGLEGDLQNVIKTVGVDIPASVTVVEANSTGGTRWFQLSLQRSSDVSGCRFQAKDNGGKVVTGVRLALVHLPKGRGGTIDFNIGPDGIPVHTPPNARADWIDTRMEGIGYNIYLDGFPIYCSGMDKPIYVSNSFLKLDIDKAEAINSLVYDTIEKANDAIKRAPAMAKGTTPFAYYEGAGGAVIAPTIFSPATTPRIIATYYQARTLYANYVIHELPGVAVSIVGARVLRMVLGRIFRPRSGGLKPPSRPLAAPIPPKIRPVNDTVNVGGTGDIPDVTNLNPVKSRSGGADRGIPNHVPAPMEKMGEIFQPGSVKKMYSGRLRYWDVDWTKATQAAAKVMPPGGRVEMNIWTSNQGDMDVLKTAFERAGFKNVRFGLGDVPATSSPGPGTMLQAVR
jgi:hypothetical protein